MELTKFLLAPLVVAVTCCSDPNPGAVQAGATTCSIKCKGPGVCFEDKCWPGDSRCTQSGECTAKLVGTPPKCDCIALTDAECSAAQGCQLLGACGVFGNRCAPVTRLGCKGAICNQHGLCSDSGPLCGATAATCAASEDCLNYGKCHMLEAQFEGTTMTYCRAGSEEDCKSCQQCKLYAQWCSYDAELHACYTQSK